MIHPWLKKWVPKLQPSWSETDMTEGYTYLLLSRILIGKCTLLLVLDRRGRLLGKNADVSQRVQALWSVIYEKLYRNIVIKFKIGKIHTLTSTLSHPTAKRIRKTCLIFAVGKAKSRWYIWSLYSIYFGIAWLYGEIFKQRIEIKKHSKWIIAMEYWMVWSDMGNAFSIILTLDSRTLIKPRNTNKTNKMSYNMAFMCCDLDSVLSIILTLVSEHLLDLTIDLI